MSSYFFISNGSTQLGGSRFSGLTNFLTAVGKGGDEALSAIQGLAKQSDILKQLDINELKSIVRNLDANQFKQLEHLIPFQKLRQLDPSDMKKLSPEGLRRLGPIGYSKLDSIDLNRLAKFDVSTTKRMSPDSLKQLDPDVLKKLDFDTLKKIDDVDFLKKLDLDDTMFKRLNIDPADAKKVVTPGVAKNADEIAEQANQVKVVINNSIENTPTKMGDETLETAADAQQSWIRRNRGLIAGGVTAAAVATAAYVMFENKNNAPFNIVKMEEKEDDSILPDILSSKDTFELILTYESAEGGDSFEFETYDSIKLTSNDAEPPLINNVLYQITEVDNRNNQVTILVPKCSKVTNNGQDGGAIADVFSPPNKNFIKPIECVSGSPPPPTSTKMGQTGTFIYQTDFNNSLRSIAKDSTALVTGAAIDVTAGVAGGLADAGGDALGVDGSTFKWIIGGIIGFIFLIIIGYLIFKLM